ncbi:hypothetical protein SLS62_002831, partial [Diatrype stigma]
MAHTEGSQEAQPLLAPDVTQSHPSTSQPAERYRDDVDRIEAGRNYDRRDFDRGDGDGPGTEFRITPILLFRVIIVILTLTNIVLQLVFIPNVFAAVMLIIWTFIAFFWNILASIPSKVFRCCFGRGEGRGCRVPEFGLVLGDKSYYITGGNDDDRDGKKAIGASLLDLLLALLIMLFTVDSITSPGWRRRAYRGSNDAITALHFTVMALELFVAVCQHVAGFRAAIVRLHVRTGISRNDNYQYRIQLPQDPQ